MTLGRKCARKRSITTRCLSYTRMLMMQGQMLTCAYSEGEETVECSSMAAHSWFSVIFFRCSVVVSVKNYPNLFSLYLE